jgi:hypothetical protein
VTGHVHSSDGDDDASHDHHSPPGQNGFWRSRAGLVTIGFLVIAAFYLVTEHRAHLLGWLPWIILLACPLLHVFMHGGHGGHGGQSNDGGSSPSEPTSPHQH